MPLSRYLAHAFILITVVAVSGYASISRSFSFSSLRLGAVNAEGLVTGQGGEVGNVTLGRLGTIIKQPDVPTAAPVPHIPIVYVVSGSESTASIASKFGITPDDVRWSNPWMTSDKATNGQRLAIPPIRGVVATAKQGQTAEGVAAYYHVDATSVIDFNYLRTDALSNGQRLVIPNGVGPAIPRPTPTPSPTPTPTPDQSATGTGYAAYSPQPASSSSPSSYSGGSVQSGGAAPGSYGASRFPYGYCTWYVATRTNVTWIGNAWQWYGNAAAQGVPVGQTPRPGSIMVSWESSDGHVAYVEKVNSDGSFVISEMNYQGWGVVDTRTIRPGQVPIIGFIYPR